MIDFKRKPRPDKGDEEIKRLIDDVSESDAKRYGYKSEIKGKNTYYYHDEDDPNLEIYNHNEYLIKLMKLLSDCLFDMERAIEIDYNVTASDILERETLGQNQKDMAWYEYWLKIDEDIKHIEARIEISENLLLEDNKIVINGSDLIERITNKYNLEFEYTRFMPVGLIAYDQNKKEIVNISPNDLNHKKLKKMIKELKDSDELKS